MQDLETDKLSNSIDMLIEICEQLKNEKLALQKQHTQLIQERNELLKRNEDARLKVEKMLEKLDALEFAT